MKPSALQQHESARKRPNEAPQGPPAKRTDTKRAAIEHFLSDPSQATKSPAKAAGASPARAAGVSPVRVAGASLAKAAGPAQDPVTPVENPGNAGGASAEATGQSAGGGLPVPAENLQALLAQWG